MAHGYLGDGYGSHGDVDPDREEHDRDRHRREHGWRGSDDWRERSHGRDDDRGMMFGDSRERSWSGDDDRWTDRLSSDRDRYRDRAGWSGQGQERDRSFGSSAFGGSREHGRWAGAGDQARQNFSAHRDDHYRSWRDQQMSELDRDYADYCREREQQFHREFDEWRSQRQGNPQPLQTGMTQTGMSQDPSGELQLIEEADTDFGRTDPMGAATVGTNSEGRKRR